MWKIILFCLLSITVFSQEPDFQYKSYSIPVDSVAAGVEVRKIQGLLASEKNPVKLVLLQKAAQNYAWLDALRKDRKVILVNIPSATMRIFSGAEETLLMKVIVGKRKIKRELC